MFFKILGSKRTKGLGLGLRPGDEHYRAYIGPPEDYDLVSAMVFNLLTSIGLRQHHKVLDIGCGSLRVGRLLIPYLNAGGYVGVEPNKWLVEDGIRNEIGKDLIAIKKPTLIIADSLNEFDTPQSLDYAVAQSIFSHCGKDLIRNWLSQVSGHLKDSGALLATFLVDTTDFEGSGWVYPGCVKFRPETLAEMGREFGFEFQVLDWAHPRQTWALFSKKDFDKSLIEGGPISWNRFVAKAMADKRKPSA
jgi:cyclopropane fatty-acyl-phospholipid synthase-like methyltransferase